MTMQDDYPTICRWVAHRTVSTEKLREELLRALAWCDEPTNEPTTTVIGWHESPEEPGVLRPLTPVKLKMGDTFTLTTHLVDGVMMPWGECEVTQQ